MPTKMLCDADGRIVRALSHGKQSGIVRSGSASQLTIEDGTLTHDLKNRGTVPFSVAKALEEHRRRRHILCVRNDERTSSLPPIDVVAVVVSASMDVSARTADLLIGDMSLPSNFVARVSFRGSESISQMMEMKLFPGDVLRFNRLAVKKDYGHMIAEKNDHDKPGSEICHSSYTMKGQSVQANDVPTATKQSRDSSLQIDRETFNSKHFDEDVKSKSILPTVICEFHHSWKDPEPGVPFARLFKYPNEAVDANLLPSSMVTPQYVTSQLVDWFENRKMENCCDQLTNIPIAPCRRRRLCEIKRPNLISDVVVKVIDYDQHMLPMRGRKRKRSQLTMKQSACAMLSDGPNAEDIIALHECKQFQSILTRFAKDGAKMLLTRVLSRDNCAASTKHADIILVPTNESAVIFMGAEPSDKQNKSNSGSSQSFFSGETLQMLSTTQQTQISTVRNPETSFAKPSESSAETRILLSKLFDVYFDDLEVSLSGGDYWSSPHQLINVLIEKKVAPLKCSDNVTKTKREVGVLPEYRRATLKLDADLLPKNCIVKADSKTMAILCGSIQASELVDTTDVSIARHVSDLLRGLIDESVELKWTLKRSMDCEVDCNLEWCVDHVFLPFL